MGKQTFLGKTVLFLIFTVTCANGRTIETYGDSLTAAMLSGTNVTFVPSLAPVSQIITDYANYLISTDPSYLQPHHSPELAWPVHMARLYRLQGIETRVTNFAVSGARVAHLDSQIERGRNAEADTQAFFFIGHNDLCNNPNTPEEIARHFRTQFENGLTKWDAKHQGSKAFLFPVGDIHRVYELLVNHVWYRGAERNYSCVDSWARLFPYCVHHYRKFRNNILRDDLVPKLRAIRQTLEALATEWDRKSTRNRYRFMATPVETPMDKSYFALDCFHLSGQGQAELGSAVVRDLARN